VPGVAWGLLVAGLAVGGVIGYTLRSSVGPRDEGGMPTGPADIMAGSEAGAGSGMMGGMPGGTGSPPGSMPTQVMQMIQSYKAVLAKNPDDLEANIGLGNLEFDSGQWSKAIESYTRALKIDPKNADVLVDRAIAYHSTGANDVAKTELLRVTKEFPQHKNAWLNLGVVASQLGERPVALQAWQRYLELAPTGEHSEAIRQEIENLKRVP
jgi:Flp pilus assembly protein TadD